jgi:hypothetical protein
MKSQARLEEIRGELQAMHEDYNGDFEQEHSKADRLLIEVIQLLSKGRGLGSRQLLIDITEAWENVGKWYA